MSPGERTTICLTCRTALAEDERCDLGHPDAVSLRDPRGRARLIDAVWGTAQDRWQYGPSPTGVAYPEVPFPPDRIAGRVEATQTLTAPASGTRSAGHLTVFWLYRLGPFGLTLLDGVTVGFDVVDGRGTLVRVRPGRMRIVDPPLRRFTKPSAQTLLAWLRTIDPGGPEPYPVLPFEEVQEVVLRQGQRVEIAGPFDAALDHTPESSYREAPPAVLTPQGVPRLRLLR